MTSNQKRIIASTVTFLQKQYGADVTGHDWYHLERVWKMAKRLSRGVQVNHFVVEMAALLHDVDDYKFKKAGEEALFNTKKILDPFSLPTSEYDWICDIASHVSYKGAGVPDNQKTMEGKIVQDADRLDALGALGIARTFTYNASKGNSFHDPKIPPHQGMVFEEYKTTNSTAINHFYEKLLLIYDRLHTPQAKKIGRKRHEFMKKYLQEFLQEWDGLR